ncbi:hypothetical protein OnM2_089039 [Erysiphe neolycopersici]|uniref:C2H2-type domain-containing protein n=1 Tax=Erysiphe neolycopersici TaxID=212602 RepID=A0A420HDL6_9PEZI|nr:hypothetical protein OnM2_089039 [Erysiphe neolycopersici]
MNVDCCSLRPPRYWIFFSPYNEASNSTSFAEGKTYYHDVFSFTNRIRAKADSRGSGQWVAANLTAKLDLCLNGGAELWLNLNVGFKSFAISGFDLKSLSTESYIVLGRHAGTATTEYTQILTVYHHTNAALRVSLPKPTNSTILSNFMANITETKEIWFDLYGPVFSSYANDVPHGRPMPPPNNYKLQGRRYLPNPYATQNKFQEPQGRQNYRTPLNRPMANYGSRQYLPQQKPSDRWHNHTILFGSLLKAAPIFPTYPIDSNDNYHISNTLLLNVDSTITKNKFATTYRSAFDKSQSPILCSICNESFSSRNRSHNHIRTLHGKSKNPPLVETDPLSIVVSTAKNSIFPPGFGFRGLRYAQIQIMLHSPGNDKNWVCLDSGCTMSLIDKNFLLQQYPTAKLLTMSTPMTVRGIGNHTYDTSQFLQVDIFLPKGKVSAGHIKKILHVVNCLPAKVLLGVDIMSPEGWCVNFESQTLTLPHCSGIQLPYSSQISIP